jgi:septal ring factor EnvC (AmiA/AmiB activator)
MKSNNQGFHREKIFSVVITFAIILTLGYGIYSVMNSTGKSDGNNNIVNLNDSTDGNVALKTEDVTDALPDDIKGNEITSDAEAANAGASSAEKMSKQAATEATKPETATQAAANVSANAAKATKAASYSFSDKDTLMWPVNGDVILKYSMDSTIYFQSLGVYKCNPAIDIASPVGTNVGVAAAGVVESVETSEETGTTVIIDIGSGYVTTYEVVVKKGDTVVAGQLLGKVAEPTAYYSKEGSNLYFKLTKDGTPVDPTQLFAK